MERVHTAVIGCGAISWIYLHNMREHLPTLEVVCCCATCKAHAEERAAQFGIAARDLEDVLNDPSIELLVILTPPASHYSLIRQGLLSGKHAYVEKPIAQTLEEAQDLIALANQRHLCLGCAPETFLGSALQTARKALDEGIIGQVTSFHVVANRDLTVLAAKHPFLQAPGNGITSDYGVYYLTALVSLLGPMERVYAQVSNLATVRVNPIPFHPDYGKEYLYNNESQVHAVLTTKSGIPGTFALNGDSAFQDQAYFTIQGTKGILRLGDANQFGGAVSYVPNHPEGAEPQYLEMVSPLWDNCRGIGPAQMTASIREGAPVLPSGELAAHVLDVVLQILESGKTGLPQTIHTSCPRPEPFTDWQRLIR